MFFNITFINFVAPLINAQLLLTTESIAYWHKGLFLLSGYDKAVEGRWEINEKASRINQLLFILYFRKVHISLITIRKVQ